MIDVLDICGIELSKRFFLKMSPLPHPIFPKNFVGGKKISRVPFGGK
jgi:hypothetical protein